MNGERRPVRAKIMSSREGPEPEEMTDRVARPVFAALRAMVTAGFSISILDPT
jgi:hypothetical protein